jgi:hypothetical protein
MIMQRNFE